MLVILIWRQGGADSKLTPMLIKAIIIRIERENMIELSGMGVPMVVTWNNVSIT